MNTEATKDDPRKFLDPRALAKVRSLELKASTLSQRRCIPCIQNFE